MPAEGRNIEVSLSWLTGGTGLPPPATMTPAVAPPAIVVVVAVPAVMMMAMPTLMGRHRCREDGAAENDRESQGTA